MNKNIKRIFYILIFLMIFIILISNQSFATSDLIDGMDPSSVSDDVTDSTLMKIVARIFTIIQFAGTGFSIIAIMKLGISYMFSSIEEKAEIKKRATPILIGSFIIVATVNILKIIQKVVVDSL